KAKPIKTPMPTNGHLDLDQGGKDVDQKVYHSMIGSLLYLCASRPDIMLSVCMYARFQANPKECHLMAVKRIFRYLVHTPNLGLWYPKGSTFELLGYSDSDYAGCKLTRKSTTGTCQIIGRSLVSWSSKKQNSVALSTAEAEYVAADACCAQSWKVVAVPRAIEKSVLRRLKIVPLFPSRLAPPRRLTRVVVLFLKKKEPPVLQMKCIDAYSLGKYKEPELEQMVRDIQSMGLSYLLEFRKNWNNELICLGHSD
ncbi:secreted RxLR effector protein 161-like, partial [Miscanthus floridulus]|uniref:secreted RxLR effector protein 161-like n=1 Tax=Miscanthus floridulus TaxID=154761 RepID=UPI00345B10E1